MVASLLLIGLDTTMAYLALPSLMVELPIGDMAVRLVLIAYFATFGVLLLPLSALGDRIGQHRLLLAGLVLFGAGAAVTAFATTSVPLVLARVVMGAGAAVVMPTALALLPGLVDPSARPKVLAGASAAVILGVCLGPLLGGWLLEHFWWGSVFLVHVPVVLLALVTVALLPPGGAGATRAAPARGSWTGWPIPVLGLVYALLMGVLFVVTPYLRGVGDSSGLGLGLRLLPLVAGLLLGVAVGERLGRRVGPRPVVVAGMVVLGGGLLALTTVDAGTGISQVAAILAAAGVGSGLSLAAGLRAASAAAPDDFFGVMRRTTAARQVGAGVGVAILGITLVLRYRDRLDQAVPAAPEAARDHLGGALATGEPALQLAARLAYVDGLHAAAVAGVVLAALAAALPFLLNDRSAEIPTAVPAPEQPASRGRWRRTGSAAVGSRPAGGH
ncbi:MFS transporter [Micromonospora sp. CA-259024]|uniref:MFS transporter n=1 Tax=Micromonospora sp. CA-259024 TaxID=3239965 RepID=UPI003D8CF49F